MNDRPDNSRRVAGRVTAAKAAKGEGSTISPLPFAGGQTHPGETLRDLLEERHLSQADVARRAGISPPHLNDILAGKRGIGPRVAVRLDKLGLGSTRFWLTRQAHHALAVLLKRLRA